MSVSRTRTAGASSAGASVSTRICSVRARGRLQSRLSWRLRKGGLSQLRRSGCYGFPVCLNGSNYGIDLDGLAFRDLDLGERPKQGLGFRHRLRIRVEQGLVALHFVTRLLQPFCNSSFNNRLAHLGHDDVSWHDFLPGSARCSAALSALFTRK